MGDDGVRRTPSGELQPGVHHGSLGAGHGHGRRWRPPAWPAAVLFGCFVASRSIAFHLGVRFNADHLRTGVHLLDPQLLRDRLIESLWYQHTQPPLFNLLTGLMLKAFPTSPALAMQVLWMGFGLALMAVSYRLLRALSVARPIAVIVTVLVTCSPTMILYENDLSYEYPLAFVLTALVLASLRWAATGKLRWLAAAAGLAGAATLTRSLLHPGWYVAVVGLVLLARRPTGRWVPAAVAIAGPIVVMSVLMMKNQVLFGEPQLSSWTGWSLHRVTVEELPLTDRYRMIDEHQLTPLAFFSAMWPLDIYATGLPPCRPTHPEVPALAQATKSTGAPNFNAECYLPITQGSRDNAVTVARARPATMVNSVAGAAEIWAQPASMFAFVNANRHAILGWDEGYRQWVLWEVPYDPPVRTQAGEWMRVMTPDQRWRFSTTMVLGTVATIAAGFHGVRRLRRRRRATSATLDRDTALAVAGLTVLWVTVVGNVLEIGENNRFRVIVEPLTFIVLTWTATAVARRIRHRLASRRAGERSPPPGEETTAVFGGTDGGGQPADNPLIPVNVHDVVPSQRMAPNPLRADGSRIGMVTSPGKTVTASR